eukprot:3345111-Prymnesium_polylepis.3
MHETQVGCDLTHVRRAQRLRAAHLRPERHTGQPWRAGVPPRRPLRVASTACLPKAEASRVYRKAAAADAVPVLSLIHISEPTRRS